MITLTIANRKGNRLGNRKSNRCDITEEIFPFSFRLTHYF